MNDTYANTAYSGTNVVTLANAPARRWLSQPAGSWSEFVRQELDELVKLDPGWDGYCGVPVGFANAYFALRVLEAICLPRTPAPQIVPGTFGDLQIEWHTDREDIELHVLGPNSVRAWRRLSNQVHGETLNLTNDFLDIANWIRDLAESADAADSAAA